MRVFTKRRPDAPRGFFEWEAAGLAWLAAAGGARVVEVLGVEAGRIDLEALDPSRPTAAHARALGAALAVTHDAGAEGFGAPPPDYDAEHSSRTISLEQDIRAQIVLLK